MAVAPLKGLMRVVQSLYKAPEVLEAWVAPEQQGYGRWAPTLQVEEDHRLASTRALSKRPRERIRLDIYHGKCKENGQTRHNTSAQGNDQADLLSLSLEPWLTLLVSIYMILESVSLLNKDWMYDVCHWSRCPRDMSQNASSAANGDIRAETG